MVNISVYIVLIVAFKDKEMCQYNWPSISLYGKGLCQLLIEDVSSAHKLQ